MLDNQSATLPDRRAPGFRLPQRAREPLINQRNRLLDTIKRDEATEPRALRRAQEHFIDRFEPVAQRLKAMLFADSEHRNDLFTLL